MNEQLLKRIDEKETWTFAECVGLAAEFRIKPRAVIGFVYSRGKQYIDGPQPSPTLPSNSSR